MRFAQDRVSGVARIRGDNGRDLPSLALALSRRAAAAQLVRIVRKYSSPRNHREAVDEPRGDKLLQPPLDAARWWWERPGDVRSLALAFAFDSEAALDSGERCAASGCGGSRGRDERLPGVIMVSSHAGRGGE